MSDSTKTRALALVDSIHNARKLVDAVFALIAVEIDADEVLNVLRRDLEELHEDAHELHDILKDETALAPVVNTPAVAA